MGRVCEEEWPKKLSKVKEVGVAFFVVFPAENRLHFGRKFVIIPMLFPILL